MNYELSVILPCLNEELTIQKTIDDIKKFINRTNISCEIILIDNASTDKSVDIAKKNNLKIVSETKKGYGLALRKGIENANGKYIIMGDCDSTYDFEHMDIFLEKLREGYLLVMGNRYLGGFEKDSISLSHYYGAKILSFLGKKKYKVEINDFHCGIRGFDRKMAQNMNFKTTGMEFATELIKEFSIYKEKVIEVPTKLKKGNINRKSHLNTVRDGVRHLLYIIKE